MKTKNMFICLYVVDIIEIDLHLKNSKEAQSNAGFSFQELLPA